MTTEANFHAFQPKWTYSQGCGCRVTLAEDGWYLRVTPGKYCTMHTLPHQEAAKQALVAMAKAALAEYRHVIASAAGRFMLVKQHGQRDLYAVVDGDLASEFMPLAQALRVAQSRFGRVILPVWECDLMGWVAELATDSLC